MGGGVWNNDMGNVWGAGYLFVWYVTDVRLVVTFQQDKVRAKHSALPKWNKREKLPR